MRASPIAVAMTAAAVLAAAPARADSGALFGESARAASMADAVTGQPGDLSAIFFNPGALADLPDRQLSATVQGGLMRLWFQRDGEPRDDMNRSLTGFAVSLGARLPGPDWLQRFRIGVAAHVPARYALRIQAPPRSDVPSFPMYAGRAARTAFAATLAVDLWDHVQIGYGISLTPSLFAPTQVRFDATRGETVDEGVVVDLDRSLRMGASIIAGLRIEPIEELGFGLAFRQEMETRAFGCNDTAAATVVIGYECRGERAPGEPSHNNIDFNDYLAPNEVAVGVAGRPRTDLTLAADLVWSQWSKYHTIHNRFPTPRFHNTVSLRVGGELRLAHGWAVRAGYGFEPSPVPSQRGDYNLLDGDRHVLTAGAGLDLRELTHARVRIDLYVRGHVLHRQHVVKDPEQITDADPETPDRQIDNLGFPGFRSGGGLIQGGLTLTLFFGSDEGEP